MERNYNENGTYAYLALPAFSLENTGRNGAASSEHNKDRHISQFFLHSRHLNLPYVHSDLRCWERRQTLYNFLFLRSN
jgi:hypothetical protein